MQGSVIMYNHCEFYNLHAEQTSLNLDIQFSGEVTCVYPNWNFKEPPHAFNRLYFIIDAEGTHIDNERGSCNLRPGHMYLIPAYFNCAHVCESYLHKYYLHFTLEMFPGLDLIGHMNNEILELPYSQELLDQFLAAEKNTDLINVIGLKVLLWQVIHKFISQYQNNLEYKILLDGFFRQRHILQYLSTHLDATLRIQDIADTFHITARQLSRGFQQDVGLALKSYMEQMLFSKASRLLLCTTAPIYQISEQLGFSDPFYFSRFFKKFSNVTPSIYRKQQF